jgi:hypothetical protein
VGPHLGSCVEAVVLHRVLPWERLRLVADLMSLWGVVWMLGYAATLATRPHVVTGESLVARAGAQAAVVLPWDQVASVTRKERSLDRGRAVQIEGSVLSLVVSSRTNVDVRLTEPITFHGSLIGEVRLLCDDPEALLTHLSR